LLLHYSQNSNKTIKLLAELWKNTHYGVLKGGELETPKLKKVIPIKDGETEIGLSYLYKLPVGVRGEVLSEFVANALGKPVEVEFKRGEGLYVHVYHEELKEMIRFSEVPSPPEDSEGNTMKWTIPLGKGLKGWVWHCFDHTPHMTIAGTTRFGKTVLLRLIMTYLIMYHQEDVEFYIIDLKGKLESNRYRNLRQIKWIAGTPSEAMEMLTYLTNEEEIRDKKTGEVIVPLGILEKEMAYFEKNYISNITETKDQKRRFIIVDEGAQLAPNKFTGDEYERKICQYKLSRIASVFGALGVRLIFGTQYPKAEYLNPNVKMNSDAKISFRLPAGYASKVAIDETGAEKLPSHFKGRALMKTHDLKEMQVPLITHEEAWKELQRYQDPWKTEGEPEHVIPYRQETNETGGNTEHPGQSEIRDTRTNSSHTWVRF
jgi:S-DNA-T family DNA segregation ATPase FtsK/SpoIIIE